MTEEIYPQFTEAQAKKEAGKARKNLKDCAGSCPIGIDLMGFVDLIKAGQYEKAADMMYKDNPFPCITGRLCSAPCQTQGTHKINVKALERFIGDNYLPQVKKSKKNKQRVAIIGAGISGIVVANALLEKGVDVTIIESQLHSGGFLRDGIPTFRLPRAVLEAELDRVMPHVQVSYDSIAGTMYPLEDLAKKYDSVVICTGASKPVFSLPGEQLNNVYTPIEYYHESSGEGQIMGQSAIVIGNSNIALDAAITARTQGARAMVVHHGELEEAHLDRDLFSSALKQGVKFLLLTKPTALLGEEGEVSGLSCQQMRLAEDYDGGRTAIPIDESHFTTECDHVILAQGFEANPTISVYSNLRTSGKNRIWTNSMGQTTIPNVFASGGIVLGFKPVENIIAHAQDVASNVLLYLKENK